MSLVGPVSLTAVPLPVWVTVMPGASLSVIAAVTGSTARPLYAASALARVWAITAAWGPSAAASSTAVTVTVRGTFQLPVVKVTV